MPRLIKIDETKKKTITHNHCGAVIEYFEYEVKSYVHYDYGGGSDTVYYIECPNPKCNDKKIKIRTV